LVTNAPIEYEVDHIDGDKLNNRSTNLRICTTAQNCANRGPRSDNSSGTPGVKFDKAKGKWASGIGVNRSYVHLGYFNNINDAINARKEAEIKYHGDFAHNSKTVYTAGGELLAQQ
jgi:hypothetical protein